MSSAEDFIYQQEEDLQLLLLPLRELFLSYPGVTAKLRYKIPFYYRKSWVCYTNPIKGQGVEVAFLRGFELGDPQGVLQDKGRKMVKGIDIFNPNEIEAKGVELYWREALMLEEL